MRILHALLAFYPCQSWGGPPQNAFALCKGLQRRGHDVSVLTTNILDYHQRMSKTTVVGEWEGLPVTYLDAHWRGHRPNSVGFIWSNDIDTLRREYAKADIIHIHGYRDFMFFTASLFSNIYGKPYIVQPRGTLPAQLGRNHLKRFVDIVLGRHLVRRAVAGLALSNEEARYFSIFGLPTNRIYKVFNPFDPALCPEIPSPDIFRNRYNVPADTKIILFLARLHIKKGLDLLIQAIDGLQSNHDFKLFIVGPDDGYEASARELANTLGLSEQVVFVGPLYNHDKFEAYSAADIFVLPTSGMEGLPTTIIEACYVGTPIVVTRQTEIADLIDNKVGIAVENNVYQLRQALEKMLNDDDLRRYYRQNTVQFIRQHFDLDTILDQIEDIYSTSLFKK